MKGSWQADDAAVQRATFAPTVVALADALERTERERDALRSVVAYLWPRSGCADPAHPMWANAETSAIFAALRSEADRLASGTEDT